MIQRRTLLKAGLSAGLAGGWLSRGGVSAFGQSAQRKPNVILIVAGVWRAQAVPWAGDTDVDAPNLAKLSRQSLAFSRAYSSCARASRALPGVLRGVYPHTLLGMDATVEQLLAESPSLKAVLQGAGYRAAAFTARQADEIVSFIHRSDAERSDGQEQADQPFFVEWGFDKLSGSGLIERHDPSTLHLRENVPAYAVPEAKTELRDFYARVSACDREIGVVLEALDLLSGGGAGLAENTIVIFTSLHGDMLGSHGLRGDDSWYEESVRIPLLIRHPRAFPQAGSTDILVSQVDLAPTLLGWCGVPVPGTAQGRDLSALLSGEAGPAPGAVYAEGGFGQKDEWRMLVEGYDKLVSNLDGTATHMFHLADDPYEMTNLAAVATSQLKRDEMLAQMKLWRTKLEDGVDGSGLKKRV